MCWYACVCAKHTKIHKPKPPVYGVYRYVLFMLQKNQDQCNTGLVRVSMCAHVLSANVHF